MQNASDFVPFPNSGRGHAARGMIVPGALQQSAEMREKVPPVPPPVVHHPPPVPPPVQVELPHRRSGRFRIRRRLPRGRLSLVAAVLVLICCGLLSDEKYVARPQVANATDVAHFELASSIQNIVRLSKAHRTEVDALDSALPAEPALEDIEEEVVVRQLVFDPAKASEDRAKLESEVLLESANADDDSNEWEASPESNPQLCQPTKGTDRLLGTEIQWAETANEAAMIAEDQGKLVYLIQVSGNFEIPEFT